MFTLYYAPNTCALASHIALEQAGANYETVRVDFSRNDQKVPQSVGECFEVIEREMLQGPWVRGDHYSVSDIYLFTLARWLEADGVDPERFPKVADHRRRMSQHPVVSKVVASELASS